jgi:hypothetical protein
MVEVTTFDREIHSDSYALCKMDIEGAELDALKGAATSLRRLSPPVWVMELSEKNLARSSHSVADVEAFRATHGYHLWRYDSGELVPFVSMDRKPGRVGDGIAIAENAGEMVRARLRGD